jgi:hypothetical protein
VAAVRKKLIEVALPLKEFDEAAAREKSIRLEIPTNSTSRGRAGPRRFFTEP